MLLAEEVLRKNSFEPRKLVFSDDTAPFDCNDVFFVKTRRLNQDAIEVFFCELNGVL